MAIDDEVLVRRLRVHADLRRAQRSLAGGQVPADEAPDTLVLARDHLAMQAVGLRDVSRAMPRDLQPLTVHVWEAVVASVVRLDDVHGHLAERIGARGL